LRKYVLCELGEPTAAPQTPRRLDRSAVWQRWDDALG